MYEFFTDITLVFFNFYTDCRFELLLISLGQLFSKSSSAFNYSNAVGFLMYEYFQNQAGSPIKDLDTATTNFVYASATDTDKQDVGKALGRVVSQLFSFQIPVYEVNAFQSVEQTKTV